MLPTTPPGDRTAYSTKKCTNPECIFLPLSHNTPPALFYPLPCLSRTVNLNIICLLPPDLHLMQIKKKNSATELPPPPSRLPPAATENKQRCSLRLLYRLCHTVLLLKYLNCLVSLCLHKIIAASSTCYPADIQYTAHHTCRMGAAAVAATARAWRRGITLSVSRGPRYFLLVATPYRCRAAIDDGGGTPRSKS